MRIVPLVDGYAKFLHAKRQHRDASGFEPIDLPDYLFDFQRALVEWALRQGRAAIFADCGLGKTPMQLVWADNVIKHTSKPVLIIAPLAVSHQTAREAVKFSIECKVSQDGTVGKHITVTNYERLYHFDPDDFGGVVCDECSVIKNFRGKRRVEITEFMRTRQYRLLCTATAAPNDYQELGTSSEALGYLGYRDMITRFFKQETTKDHLGWGRTTYRFRGHAETPFWKWVCSWARSCRRPSDLGFDNDGFILPPLKESEILIKCDKPREGMLIAIPAEGLQEQREERRNTLQERCEVAAKITHNHDGATVIWCHLNDEGDLLERLVDGGVQVSGSMSLEQKEERLLGFQSGAINTLITKPKIGCFGLNWQHCHNVVSFPSHSWEQYYQAVRRCWRFGQKHSVHVTLVTSEGEQSVLRNLQRKAAGADRMFESLITYMNDAICIGSEDNFNQEEMVPAWLS